VDEELPARRAFVCDENGKLIDESGKNQRSGSGGWADNPHTTAAATDLEECLIKIMRLRLAQV